MIISSFTPTGASPPDTSNTSVAGGDAGIDNSSTQTGKTKEVNGGASSIGVENNEVAAMRPTDQYNKAQSQGGSASAPKYQQATTQSQSGCMFATQQPQPPHSSMVIHQHDMLNPMFLLMAPQQQQQIMLFQQQAQLMTEQSFQLQNLKQFWLSAFMAAPEVSSQNRPTYPAQNYYAQQMAQSVMQHQFVNQSLVNAAVAQAQYSLQGQIYKQAAVSAYQSLFLQAPNVSLFNAPSHPFCQDHQNHQGRHPSALQVDASNHHEGNNDVNDENYDDDEDSDDDSDRPSRSLLRLVEDHQWIEALQRMTTHPHETHKVGMQGRTPLHVACDHDAPAPLVQALLSAWPEGAERVGTSQMNPLHITCSSPNASVDVVRILLAGCRDPSMITGAKDVDGDTPLHAACRFAAPNNVLVTLLQANPAPITWKDYEGLNPLTRLWVRYFVLVGEDIISNIKQPSDLTSDLVEAWEKSLLLLQVMHAEENRGREGQNQVASFRAVHAASSVDCPRCVTRIAMVVSPQQLLIRDELNRLPIHIAAAAPVYYAHDLRGEGFTIEDAYIDDDPQQRAERSRMKESQSKYKEPSVIDILLSGEPAAARELDPHGQLPLHLAIMRGKVWDDGVKALVEAFPDALTTPDNKTNLYPFMLAASVGGGRGDCTTIYALLRAAPDLVHMSLEASESEENPVALKSDS